MALVGCGSGSSGSQSSVDAGNGSIDGSSGDVIAPGMDGTVPSGDSAPPVDGSGPPMDAQPTPEGGGPPEDGGSSDAETLGDGSTPYVGRVAFQQLQQGADSFSYIDIHFSAAGGLDPELTCPPGSTTGGACCYIPKSAADAGAPAPVSAGTIDIFVDTAPLTPSIAFGPTGYDPTTAQASLWMSGNGLRATAAGATVQAFSGTIVAPDAPANATPWGTTVTAGVGSDWTMTWTAEMNGQPIVGSMITSGGTVQCVVKDTGTLTFPATLMGHFTTPGMGTLELSRAAFSSVSAPNAYVQFAALMGVAVPLQLTP
jgi:hypothetical protein